MSRELAADVAVTPLGYRVACRACLSYIVLPASALEVWAKSHYQPHVEWVDIRIGDGPVQRWVPAPKGRRT